MPDIFMMLAADAACHFSRRRATDCRRFIISLDFRHADFHDAIFDFDAFFATRRAALLLRAFYDLHTPPPCPPAAFDS
jgi:hypothetical protein